MITPVVGMGVTECMWSDRLPYTIVSVSEDLKTIGVRGDDYRRTDKNGFSESQTYEYTERVTGPVVELTLRKNGRYVRKGEPMREGSGWWIGRREAYFDPSF